MYTDFSNGKTILKTGSNFNVEKDYRRASNDVVATEFEVSVNNTLKLLSESISFTKRFKCQTLTKR